MESSLNINADILLTALFVIYFMLGCLLPVVECADPGVILKGRLGHLVLRVDRQLE
jgi:hypothetical protein